MGRPHSLSEVIVERGLVVPMRDGVRLTADVHRPATERPVPALLCRTCYDRSFSLSPGAAIDPERATDAGFALVLQDVRGRHASEGEFQPFVSEAQDGFDTVEWVAAQPWCSGAVGMVGRSYPAASQWLAAAEHPPHLQAIAPVVIGSHIFDGWVYQGGAFQLGFNLFWVSLMTRGRPRPPLAEQFRHLPLEAAPLVQSSPAGEPYREWLRHPTDDGFWAQVSPRGRYGRVTVPAYNIGGWYDLFLGGTLENYARMRREAGSERARSETRLLIGPWMHGSAYGAYPDHHFDVFGDEQRIDLDELQLAFFARHLRGEGNAAAEPPVRLFVMGANRWRSEDAWPLVRARPERWYLHAGGRLSPEPPAESPPDRYRYDPSDPAPTIGGPTSLPAKFMRTNSGPLDQAPLESREDVLVFSSAPLSRPLEVTGPLECVLHAASSAPDTDFVAKLCDVDPAGHSRILAEGVIRARYRETGETPSLIEPGRPYAYTIDLVATSNVFLAGHRIRLLITSSSFPRFDRNPNSGLPFATDGPDDLRAATQSVFHDPARASHVCLAVVA
jgi:uncharacterized protein